MHRLLCLVIAALVACALTVPAADRPLRGAIDIHGHLGRFEGFDLSLPTLLAEIGQAQLQYVLVSNIDGAAVPGATADLDEKTVNLETLRVTRQHKALIPLAWARPGANRSGPAIIEPFLRDHHFRGIKLHPDFNHFRADAPTVDPYMALCRRYHVPALFHCGSTPNSSPQVIYVVAKRFPDVPVVLYHMGFGTDHRAAIEVATQARDRHDALIYLDSAQADGAFVVDAIKSAGIEHVMFGTDATYYGHGHYDRYLDQVHDVAAKVSPQDLRRFLHDNAAALFRLP